MPKSRDPITCQNHYTHNDFYMLFLRPYLSFFLHKYHGRIVSYDCHKYLHIKNLYIWKLKKTVRRKKLFEISKKNSKSSYIFLSSPHTYINAIKRCRPPAPNSILGSISSCLLSLHSALQQHPKFSSDYAWIAEQPINDAPCPRIELIHRFCHGIIGARR